MAGDRWHQDALGTLRGLRANVTAMLTHNYVVLEATAVLQNRHGPESVRALHDGLLAVVDVVWVDEELHRAAVAALLASGRRDISLVDWISFDVMRRRGIERAFAFDPHFAEHGFRAA